jgi:hypothetical protein
MDPQKSNEDQIFRKKLATQLINNKNVFYDVFFNTNSTIRHSILCGTHHNPNFKAKEPVTKTSPNIIKEAAENRRKLRTNVTMDTDKSIATSPNDMDHSISKPLHKEDQPLPTATDTTVMDNSAPKKFPFLKRTSRNPEPKKLDWKSVRRC